MDTEAQEVTGMNANLFEALLSAEVIRSFGHCKGNGALISSALVLHQSSAQNASSPTVYLTVSTQLVEPTIRFHSTHSTL